MLPGAQIIGIVGLINSGKDTIGHHLVKEHKFIQDSYAAPLKDAVATIFDWPRGMLEGDTKGSRFWRDQVDTFWSKKLNDPEFTPRKALQHIGTEVVRENFNQQIWVLSLERRFGNRNKNTVITDCRFPNEIELIHSLNGSVIEVTRGPEPEWYAIAREANRAKAHNLPTAYILHKQLIDLKIHASEYSWIGSRIDYSVTNDTTIEELYKTIDAIVVRINEGN